MGLLHKGEEKLIVHRGGVNTIFNTSIFSF